MYFELKTTGFKNNGSKLSQLFITNAISFTDVEVKTNKHLEGQTFEVETIAKKNYINVFQNNEGEFYYKVSIEWEDLESKIIKETYLQQASSIDQGKFLLLKNIKGDVEVKAIVETKILEFI